jgi:hypothetical protein
MKAVVVNTLTVALALALFASAHGAELVSTAMNPARSDHHDCGCSDGCSCRGPVKGCNCSTEGAGLKTSCGCGCSDGLHAIGGSTWKSLLARSCDLRAPTMIWTPAHDRADAQAWRLAYEHKHPPRALS